MAGAIAVNSPTIADWADTLVDPAAFAREQAKLAHHWTLLGLANDLAADGDWIRASIATRSVFVQRFGDQLKGFENVCAHRFYPLRTADRGNGPVVCGFHHWRYDQNGQALGIPMCQELFGAIPRDLNAKLTPLDIATCGNFVFGRFPGPDAAETLEQSLGDVFPIIEAMSKSRIKPLFTTRPVKANWKFCYQIGLDDYHVVAVHPETFGKIGYLKRENLGYFRFGLHSAYFTTPAPDAIQTMAEACRAGTWVSANYRIFQIFPNLSVLHFKADARFWYVLVLQYIPVGPDRTIMRGWFYPAPFPTDHGWFNRWTAWYTELFRPHIVRFFIGKVLGQDHAVCERLQTGARQIKGRPFVGGLEERVAWFEESYAQAMTDMPGKKRDFR